MIQGGAFHGIKLGLGKRLAGQTKKRKLAVIENFELLLHLILFILALLRLLSVPA